MLKGLITQARPGCRAAAWLAHETVVTEDGLHPQRSREPLPLSPAVPPTCNVERGPSVLLAMRTKGAATPGQAGGQGAGPTVGSPSSTHPSEVADEPTGEGMAAAATVDHRRLFP